MGFIHANGTALERDGKPLLLRGFGLGGWLLPEGYMWKLPSPCDRPRRMEVLVERLCGKPYAESFWRRYLDSFLTEKDIARIAAGGFNCVRLPLNARHLANGTAWPYLDECIAWCRQYNVYVMLDMHAAPGGQTGQNIDDSERDQPELFQNPEDQDELVELWRQLARRYRHEEIIAGYDLLNEPLPNFFAQYNAQLLPLYRRLAGAIRREDAQHLLVLEGLHWATDFSVFEPLRAESMDGNIMLQFHKYWSEPDVESLRSFIQCSEALNLPLFAGESGENNLDWYAAAFPMYERHGISWSFWTYKKMACDNSPVTFAQPEGWEKVQACALAGLPPAAQTQGISPAPSGEGALARAKSAALTEMQAQGIFNAFLENIQNASQNGAVLRALTRRAPLRLPAEHFDACTGHSSRENTADYRTEEPVRIVFADGRSGKVNYKRMAGEPQPPEENLQVLLAAGEEVRYRFAADGVGTLGVLCRGEGTLWLEANGSAKSCALSADWKNLLLEVRAIGGVLDVNIMCAEGSATLEDVYVQVNGAI